MRETAQHLSEEDIAEVSVRLQALLPAAVRKLLLLALAQEFARDLGPQTSARGDQRRPSPPSATLAGEAAFPSSTAENAAEWARREDTPPRLVVNVRTGQAHYRGRLLDLPPRAFGLLVLLASRAGELVTKDEIYEHLWPASHGGTGDDRPYEYQIADHKRKLMTQLRILAATAPGLSQEEVNGLIRTKPGRGYLLNLSPREITILPRLRTGV